MGAPEIPDFNEYRFVEGETRQVIEKHNLQMGALNTFAEGLVGYVKEQGEALLVAGGAIFPTVAAGMAAAPDDGYFYAENPDPNISKTLYQRLSDTEYRKVADDPSAEFLEGVAAAQYAAIELASKPGQLDNEFVNDDEPQAVYQIITPTGQLIAQWGVDGYQVTPARGEFYNDDDTPFFAISDEEQNPLIAIDEHRQYITPWRGEFYNDDDAPDYCYVDESDTIIMSWSRDGSFDLPGISARTIDTDYITPSLTGITSGYNEPVRLTSSDAVALSPSARLLRDWYYVDGELIHRDDLPAYVPALFSASTEIASGDAQSVTVGESPDAVTITSNPTNLSGFATRYFSFALEGVAGKNPEFVINNRSSWNTERTLTRHRLLWSDHPDSDNWRSFDNQADDEPSNAWRFSNNVPFELNKIYCANVPNYSYARHEKQVGRWISHPLSKKTEGGDAAYRVGICSARTTFYLNKQVPATAQHSFKVGHGDKVVVMSSGVHPDEKPGFYQLEGAINLMLSNSDAGRRLRDMFTVYFYPAVNLQGLYAGAQRWESENGDDCNRIWGNAEISNELRSIYEPAWAQDLSDKNVIAIFDFHSTAARSPETHHARQLWYNTQDTTSAEQLFIANTSEKFAIELLSITHPNALANYLGTAYQIPIRMTVEFTHSASVGVNDWRIFGASMLQSLHEISGQL